MSGPGEGTWDCHICGSIREDRDIAVYDSPAYDLGGAQLTVHIRYCRDRPECKAAAPAEAIRRLPPSLRPDALPGDEPMFPMPEMEPVSDDIILPWEKAAEERLSDTTAQLHVEESGRLPRPPRWRWPFSRRK
jgi:hypothetical protein